MIDHVTLSRRRVATTFSRPRIAVLCGNKADLRTEEVWCLMLSQVETPAERNLRIAAEQGAIYRETVIALLQPFDEPTAAGMMPFVNLGGETVPLASAVKRLRDETPTLGALFNATAKLGIAQLTVPQFRAIRATAPELLGLRPKG